MKKPGPSFLIPFMRGFGQFLATPSPGAPVGPLRHVFLTAHLFVVGLRQSQLTRMAAAMTYRTLFGLIPVLLVGLAALATFSSEEQQRDAVRQVLHYAGLDKIEVEPVGPPAPALASDATSGSESPRLDSWIEDLVKRGKKLPYGKIQVVGILMLVYAAVSMLVEIEKAFNQIYNAPEGRSWVRRVVQYWALLTLGPLLLFLSFALMTWIQGAAAKTTIGEGTVARDWILTGLAFITTTLTSTVLLTVIYTTVPNARVQPAAAVLGALVAAVLWESGKLAITIYIRTATGFSQLYGALAVLPLFLLWLYVSWLIVLTGLQLAYSMQTYRTASAKGLTESVLIALGLKADPHPAGRPRLIDTAAPLAVMLSVAERFGRGQKTDASAISDATGLDGISATEMLEKLAGAGLVLRVSSDRETTYSLAKPAERIPAADVLDVIERSTVGADKMSRLPTTRLLSAARRSALAGKSLADLMDPAPPAREDAPAGAPVPA